MPLVERKCHACGRTFQIDRWRLKDNRRGKFCSRECSGCPEVKMNKDFFVTPSSDMAWVLGLLYSDGFLYNNRFWIKVIDKQILETVRLLMDASFKICSHEKTSAGNDVFYVSFPANKLTVTPEYWGVTERKTLCTTYPSQLQDTFAPDFIRGLFDGDGHVSLRKTKASKNSYQRNWSLLGTHDLLNGVAERLPIECSITPYRAIANLRIYALEDLQKIYQFFYYADDVPCLQRKKNAFNHVVTSGVNDIVEVNGFNRMWRVQQQVSSYRRAKAFPGARGGRKRKDNSDAESA